MSGVDLSRVAVRGLVSWLALTLLVWWFAEAVLGWFTPFIQWIIATLTDDYRIRLAFSGAGGETYLQLQLELLHRLPLDENHSLRPGLVLTVGQHVLHDLAPLIIEFTLLLMWPLQNWRQRILLLAIGMVAAFAVIGLTTPFILLGLLEIQLQQLAWSQHGSRPEPGVLQWLYFCEMGGNYLLAIAAAGLSVRLAAC